MINNLIKTEYIKQETQTDLTGGSLLKTIMALPNPKYHRSINKSPNAG
jgi:hypothetical protein